VLIIKFYYIIWTAIQDIAKSLYSKHSNISIYA